MLNHLKKKYLKNFLHKAPEPLKTVGWGGTLQTLNYLVALNVEFSGGCYQMAFWVDFEMSHTLVLGQPAMAVMPLKLMNTKTGEVLTPKTTPTPNDLVHYIELPCNVQITVPTAQVSQDLNDRRQTVILGEAGRHEFENLQVHLKTGGERKVGSVTTEGQMEVTEDLEVEDDTKVQEVPIIYTEFPPVWVDPGSGKQYAVNQENGHVEPTHMDERKGTILETKVEQNIMKMQSRIHQKTQQYLKEESWIPI